MSKRPQVVVYLTPIEHDRVIQMMASEVTGCETKSEFIRMLLAREWNRRKNLGKPGFGWQTAHRKGRPLKKSEPRIWPHLWNGFTIAA